jgi:hypothetical protein
MKTRTIVFALLLCSLPWTQAVGDEDPDQCAAWLTASPPAVPLLQDPGSDCPGTRVSHGDGSYEAAYAWENACVVSAGYFGAFAERFDFAAPVRVNCVFFDLTREASSTGGAMDVYIWADSSGVPGDTIAVIHNVVLGSGSIGLWQNLVVTRQFVDLPPLPVYAPASFWVGFWGNWPGYPPSWYLGADLTGGPGGGDPMTKVAQGHDPYPPGWQPTDSIFPDTMRGLKATGIGVVVEPGPQQAACCFPSGACQILTQAGCLNSGGIYLGDGTVCIPNPCPPPGQGACCLPDNSCVLLTGEQCSQQQGHYLGEGLPCVPDPCIPTPTRSRSWGRVKALYR